MKHKEQEYEGYLTEDEVKYFTEAVRRANKKYADNPSWYATEPGCNVKVKIVRI